MLAYELRIIKDYEDTDVCLRGCYLNGVTALREAHLAGLPSLAPIVAQECEDGSVLLHGVMDEFDNYDELFSAVNEMPNVVEVVTWQD